MKKILIISQHDDFSTDEVMNWLISLGECVIRINYNDFVNILDFKIEQGNCFFEFSHRGEKINSDEIKSVYYRRGFLNLHDISDFNSISKNCTLNRFILQETKTFQEFLHLLLEQKNHIGNYKNRSMNKLQVLLYAQKCGINIPDTYISSQKTALLELLKNKSLITKNIFETAYITEEKCLYGSYTYNIDNELIDGSEDDFLYSLFQINIKKIFEIRSFYLDGVFFTTAMLTQKNTKTVTDFRHYDNDLPTRIIPFKLTQDLEEKLRKLFEKLDLNTGSIDMIYSEDGKYYFLEINPVGQYGMIGEPCNYYLEKQVALKLK